MGSSTHNPEVVIMPQLTKRYPGPWVLIYTEKYLSRREALAHERTTRVELGFIGKFWARNRIASTADFCSYLYSI